MALELVEQGRYGRGLSEHRKLSIGGRLVGYQIRNANDELIDNIWLDNPIPNTIVDHGLQLLCGFNRGTDMTGTPGWVSRTGSNLASAGGFIACCQCGSGNTPTSLSMTGLQNVIASTITRVVLPNVSQEQAFNGTKYFLDEANDIYTITMRNTHRFTVAQTQNRQIGELGWGINGSTIPGTDFTLFSRIALPSIITVPENAYLQCTYELTIFVPGIAVTIFEGMNLGFDTLINGRSRVVCQFPVDNSPNFGSLTNHFTRAVGVGNSGEIHQHSGGSTATAFNRNDGMLMIGAVANSQTWQGMRIDIPTSLSRTEFPNLGTTWPNANTSWGDVSSRFQMLGDKITLPYSTGSFERTVSLLIPKQWRVGEPEVLFNALDINGMGYLFDNPVSISSDEEIRIYQTIKWSRTQILD